MTKMLTMTISDENAEQEQSVLVYIDYDSKIGSKMYEKVINNIMQDD